MNYSTFSKARPARRRDTRPWVSVLLLALALSPTWGQEVTGTVSGRVMDSKAMSIAGAQVTIVHMATGATRQGTTDAEGSYVFTALPIGTYQISAVHAGFKKTVHKGVELHIGDHLRADLTLEVGDLTQEISVAADILQIQSESSEQSGLISGDQVRELQLNGRSFMTLVELLPGVSSDMPDRADPNTNPSLSINGARSSASNFNIDGGSNMDVIVGSSSLNTFTSIETIAEVKVVTSTFSAEYGRGGFSQVNVVTKGGSRDFHGSFYEFFRNDALDATDFFSHQVLPLKLNNFGYTIGGPLRLPGGYNRDRKRTFFFFTQEFNHISARGEAVNTRVPTAEERRGDFRALGPGADRIFGTDDDPIRDPLTGAGFADGILPAERIDPNAVKLLGLYPFPNFRGPGTINFTSAAAGQQRWREELIRIDHHISPTWKIYGRYAQDNATVRNPYGGSSFNAVGTRFPGISTSRADRPGQNLVIHMTKIIGSTLLNESQLTWSTREFTVRPVADLADRAKLGLTISELFPANDGQVIPAITLGSGYAALTVTRYWRKRLFNLEFSNNLTKIAGRHVLKTGLLYSFGGNREHPSGANTNGLFTFNTGFSRHPVANLLLGLPFTYAEVENLVVSHARFGLFEAFIQDDFKATSRLTLNMGLRYSAYFNPYDTENVLTNFLPAAFDPARAPRFDAAGLLVPGTGDRLNGIIIAGQNSPYGKRVTENNPRLIGPRFGFAWTPFRSKKTAVRGGYGIYYTRPLIGTFINSAFDNPPFSRSVTLQQPSFRNPAEGLLAAAGVVNLTALGTPMRAPTVQQWSLGIQRQLSRLAVLDVSYVGSHGTHLFRPFNINSTAPGTPAARINASRPFLGFGNITQRQSTASSAYHSLQASFNRRLSGKLSIGAAYTYAKSIDNASSDRGASDIPPNGHNVRAERGPSDFDRTQVFTANYIYHLPGPARSGARDALLSGWQFSGITRLYSGKPFDVVLSQDVAGIGSTQNQRPHVIADTRGPRTVEEWFNRRAFARPASGTFGNMGRNSVRGPGIHKWDLSLFKNFRLREGLRLQFRSEFFNAFNHPSFATVGTSLTTTATAVNPNTGNFAVVTDTRDARVLQFALKVSF